MLFVLRLSCAICSVAKRSIWREQRPNGPLPFPETFGQIWSGAYSMRRVLRTEKDVEKQASQSMTWTIFLNCIRQLNIFSVWVGADAFFKRCKGAACLFLASGMQAPNFSGVYKEKLSFHILQNLQNFQWLEKKNRFKHAGVTFHSSGYRPLMEMFCTWVCVWNNVYPLSNTRCL